MRSIPTEVLLSWPIPNYTNPDTRGNALIIVNAVFLTLVIIVASLRLYTRLFVKRWFGSDDVFIIIALITTIGLTVDVILANVKYGWSRHVYDIPFTELAATGQVAFSAKLLFTVAATATRLSLLCFYYRLVQESGKRAFQWTLHAAVAFCIAILITFVCLIVWQCTPISNYWTYGSPADTCMNEGKATLGSGIVNCVADLLVTILPIPMVLKLQMPVRQRVAVIVLFSMGFVVTIAGIVRTWYIYKSLIAEYDETWYAYPLWIAAAVEIDLGVICASAPVLRPLLAKVPLSSVTSRMFTSTRSQAKHTARESPAGTTLQGNTSSIRKSPLHFKRRSDLGSARRSAPTLQIRQEEQGFGDGNLFELRPWDEDVERGLARDRASRSDSQEAILEKEDEQQPGSEWPSWKGTEKQKTPGVKPTSEKDMHLEPVSTRSSGAYGSAR